MDSPLSSKNELALYKAIFENSTDSIAAISTNGEYIFQNNAHRELLGYDDEELIGKTPTIHMSQEAFDRSVKALESKGRYRETIRSITKDKRYLILELSAFAIYNSDGKPEFYAGIKRDVTNRHLMEEKLKDREQQLQRLFDGFPQAAFAFERDEMGMIRVSEVSKAAQTYSKEFGDSIKGKPAEEVFGNNKAIYALIESAMSTTEPIRQEIMFENEDTGEERYAIYHLTKLSERVVLLVAIDITESKEALQALATSEEMKSIILDSIDDHFNYFTGEDMTIIYTNRAAAQSLNLQIEDLIGQKCHQLWHQRDTPCEDCPVVKAYRTKKNEETEKTTPDGRHWRVKGYPVLNPQNEVVGLVEVTRNVTSEKEVEEKLLQSEKEYREVIDSMGDAIHVVDQDLRIQMMNPAFDAWLDELGLNSDIVGKHIKEAFPFISEHTIREYEDAFETGKTIVATETTEFPERTTVVNTRKIPITRGGKAERVVTVIRDITKEDEAQRELKRSEERYRLLYENLSDGLFQTDNARTITFVSDRGAALFGYDAADLAGTDFARLLHPEERDKIMSAFENSIRSKHTMSEGLEVKGIRKDGSTFFFHITNTVLYDNGQPSGFQSLIRDVTERNRVLNELKAEKERYQALFDFSPVAIGVTTRSGEILDTNRFMQEMLGFTREELSRMNAIRLYANPSSRNEQLRELDEKGFVREKDVRLKRKDNTIIDVIMNVDIVRFGEMGEIQLSTMRDITELKKTRHELENARARAEFFNDLLTHDLNNLHQGLLSSLELIFLDNSQDAIATAKVNTALTQTQRAIELIANVRKLSLIENKQFQPIPMDVYRILREAINLAKSSFPNKEAIVSYNFGPDDCIVLADNLLLDVFYNIVHNAMKFDHADQVFIDITATRDVENKMVEIAITDRGPGIPHERQKSIFSRLESQSTSVSGVGLTLVSRIVEHYGGKVWVEDRMPSHIGNGAKFVVQLPLKR